MNSKNNSNKELDEFLEEVEPKIAKFTKDVDDYCEKVNELCKKFPTTKSKTLIYDLTFKFSMFDDILTLISELGDEENEQRKNS